MDEVPAKAHTCSPEGQYHYYFHFSGNRDAEGLITCPGSHSSECLLEEGVNRRSGFRTPTFD